LSISNIESEFTLERPERFFAEFTLERPERFFAALRMTGSEGLRMTGSEGFISVHQRLRFFAACSCATAGASRMTPPCVTLNEVKGLNVRFFAALRMTGSSWPVLDFCALKT
jgi:hypothetical protein